ncbi:MAG: chorismate synthase [Dehalococcoidia bacterium]|nr:chorismate synthase [Dehalococcoidia bacterium]
MFRFLTAGESHGKGLTVIVEGVPAGLKLDEDSLAVDLARRQVGYGRGGRMQIERDRAEITSGVRHGRTLGSPIALYIENQDWANWQESLSINPVAADIPPITRLRPGHADLAGALKYGHRDVRNILERASARETAARVAVGAVARRLAAEFGIEIHSHTLSIGGVIAKIETPIDWSIVEASSLHCADPEAEKAMIEAIDGAKAAGDTIGGIFEVIATGAPVGLGSHVHWDRRLDGRIAGAMMSIHAVKGVGIGAGFGVAHLRGSETHDVVEQTLLDPNPEGKRPVSPFHHVTNRAGGIEGGMSNGSPIVVHAALKPIPTLSNPLPSVDLLTGETVQAHFERSDVCVVPAGGVIGEAMLAIVLAEAILEKFGGDNIDETKRNHLSYVKSLFENRLFRP